LSLKNIPIKVLNSRDIELAASAINNEITVSRDRTFEGIFSLKPSHLLKDSSLNGCDAILLGKQFSQLT